MMESRAAHVLVEVEQNSEQQRDNEIIEKVRGGNREAFAELFEKYRKLVYHVAGKYLKNTDDVEDATQEVFLRSYRALDKYNSEYRFSTWLSGITRNHCLDKIRKEGHIQTQDIDDCTWLTADRYTPEEAWLEKEVRKEVRDAIEDLPKGYQEVVNMYHWQDLSYRSMSDKMEKPLSIVKNRLMRARRMLEKRLTATVNY